MRKNFLLIIFMTWFSMPFAHSYSPENSQTVNRMHIYNLQQHNDSIYVATLDSGIFRFSIDCPGSLFRVGGRYTHPVRSIAFSKNGACYACSYTPFLHSRDSLLPFTLLPQPAWSIKIDAENTLWIAGIRSIFKQKNDSLVSFSHFGEAHDIAFVGNQIAVAHRNGISIFNKESGALVREFCKGVICWTIMQFDSLFIGGGLNSCVIINKEKCKIITFGPGKNMLWSVAVNPSGILYLGTQKGLFRANKDSHSAICIGFKGICIKSLLIDNKGRLWIGRFTKDN